MEFCKHLHQIDADSVYIGAYIRYVMTERASLVFKAVHCSYLEIATYKRHLISITYKFQINLLFFSLHGALIHNEGSVLPVIGIGMCFMFRLLNQLFV